MATLLAYGRLALYAVGIFFAFQSGYEPAAIVVSLLAAGASASLALRHPEFWIEFFAVLGMIFIDFFSLAVPEIPLLMAVIYNVAAVLAGAFLKTHWRIGLYSVLMMTGFNFFSHGTQDLYPTFLQVQQHFSPATVSTLAVVYNIGAICGSLFFGSLSERIGRRRAILISSLISIPIIPLWVFAGSPLWFAVGSFLMQFMVQSAWGVVPVHLNELSPPEMRGTFPGFVYQLGNLLASVNATLQSGYAAAHGNDYATALALVAGAAAIAIALLVAFGVERHGVHLGTEGGESQAPPSGFAPQQAE
jgi:SHS family lactate transporter-like MFS transporter